MTIGSLLYLGSFMLPAANAMPGWMCAIYALWPWNIQEASNWAFFGGIMNPLVILAPALTLMGSRKLSITLAAIILCCEPLTLIALRQMNMSVSIGHFVWIAGIGLLLSPSLIEIFSVPIARVLAYAACFLFVVWAIPAGMSATLHPASAKDDFFYVSAWNLREPLLCSRIDPRASGRGNRAEDREAGTLLQADCYRDLAALTHNPELCSEVRSTNYDRLIGSYAAISRCRKSQFPTGDGMSPDSHSFVQIMRSMGYDDAQIDDGLYKVNPSQSSLYKTYDSLKDEPGFVERVKHGPTYGEEFSMRGLRPANGAEYLYEMIAVDDGEALLCERISPNAVHLMPEGGFAGRPPLATSLRAICYWDLAQDKADAAFCAKLPPAGGSWPGSTFTNQESCIRNVMMRRDPTSKAPKFKSSATPFATPAQFNEALTTIGYEAPASAANVAHATDQDYLEYFANLSSNSSFSEQRSLFLGRAYRLR
jgi:hypothetical protein